VRLLLERGAERGPRQAGNGARCTTPSSPATPGSPACSCRRGRRPQRAHAERLDGADDGGARGARADLARALLEAGADTASGQRVGRQRAGLRHAQQELRHREDGVERRGIRPGGQGAGGLRRGPQKSVAAPPEIGEIVDKMRQAQAEGKPTDDVAQGALRRARAAPPRQRGVRRSKTTKGKGGKPEVLVITAERKEAGRERAELLYEAVKAGAAVTTPAQAAKGADGPSEITGILERLQQEQARKGRKRSAAELRRELHEAVARFRQQAQAEASK
jgi:hypothetical protein